MRNNTENNTIKADITTELKNMTKMVMNNSYEIWGKRVADIPCNLMAIDETYQRIITKNVKKLLSEWDKKKCDFLVVSYRDDRFYIIDGQHRWTAAKNLGIESLPCTIFTGLTVTEESLMFAYQNRNKVRLKNYDTFKAFCACGDKSNPDVKIDLKLKEVCDKHKVTCINAPTKPRNIRGLSEARNCIKVNGIDGMDFILTVIEKAGWAHNPTAYGARIMKAIRDVYEAFGWDCMDIITSVLSATEPKIILNKASGQYPNLTDTEAAKKFLVSKVREISEETAPTKKYMRRFFGN